MKFVIRGSEYLQNIFVSKFKVAEIRYKSNSLTIKNSATIFLNRLLHKNKYNHEITSVTHSHLEL